MSAPAGTAPTTPPPGGSYDPARTTGGGLAGELARLEAQAELSFAEEFRILRELGADTAGTFLELGAGPGAVTRRLRAALPAAELIAVDIDPELVAHAGGAADRVLVADAADLPLPDRSVDFVLLRYVLQHVPSPERVLAETLRVLRPGGVVAVTEVDAGCWGVAHPAYPELAGIHARMAAAQAEAGGDRSIARRLPALLASAGFDRPVLRPFATTNADHPTEAFAPHLGPQRLEPLVAAGVLGLRDLALAADRWRRFLADPQAWVMLLGFTVAATAPADHGQEKTPNHEGAPR
ncbi:class I SAM-dependent methyltransferase [Streptacidiphilus rugosus]|uniref:class I SAM-dependent methyltransferase n=1 Tax=Streptacidiphilus rugosus TaxID=405783 RepID=UPI00068FA0C2|nr:class I SAM-dependent methyltransferase [Streptacidiphilus rugosus]